MGGKFREGFVEVSLRRRRDTIGVLAEENLIEIELKNIFFLKRVLNARGQDDLFDLALDPAIPREQEVLHHLLRDGRGAPDGLTAGVHSFHNSRSDPARVIARMGVEVFILGADKGLLYHLGDFFRRCEKSALLGKLIDDAAFGGVDPADRRRRVVGQAFVAGQILAVDDKNRPDAERDHQDHQSDQAEDRAKERHDTTKQGSTPHVGSEIPIWAPQASVKTHPDQQRHVTACILGLTAAPTGQRPHPQCATPEAHRAGPMPSWRANRDPEYS